jgi:hypothetical protein
VPSPGEGQDGLGADLDVSRRFQWEFCVDGVERRWVWQVDGAPPLRKLQPVRKPKTSARNRHMLVTAYSMTNGGCIGLESGLEHDLVRRLDRDATVLHMVPQPLELVWSAPTAGHHFPDLLTVHDFGVTVWDARAVEEQNEDFLAASAHTREACLSVGWSYHVFSGLADQERLNLLWLHGFRRKPPWSDRVAEQIRTIARGRGATLGTLLAADDGTGELISVVWHLLWSGGLSIDLAELWEGDTAVTLGTEEDT